MPLARRGDCKSNKSVIASSVERYSVVIVASSDMSHYVSDDVARQKDKKAIEMIRSLKPEGLYEVVGRGENFHVRLSSGNNNALCGKGARSY